jgi:hypothetical protein
MWCGKLRPYVMGFLSIARMVDRSFSKYNSHPNKHFSLQRKETLINLLHGPWRHISWRSLNYQWQCVMIWPVWLGTIGGDQDRGRRKHIGYLGTTHPRSHGGLGFKHGRVFNQALLARQALRLLTKPNSLCARALETKYYPNCVPRDNQ